MTETETERRKNIFKQYIDKIFGNKKWKIILCIAEPLKRKEN